VQESSFVYSEHGDAWIDGDHSAAESPYTEAAGRTAEASAAGSPTPAAAASCCACVFQAADSHHYETIIGAARLVLLDVGRPDGISPRSTPTARPPRSCGHGGRTRGVYDVVDDEPSRRALARRRSRWAGGAAPAGGIRTRGGTAGPLAMRRVSNARFRATGWQPRAHDQAGDRADGRRGRSRTTPGRCSGIALAARGDGRRSGSTGRPGSSTTISFGRQSVSHDRPRNEHLRATSVRRTRARA
jgi:hypothetical protein